jgi:hypothetical protein
VGTNLDSSAPHTVEQLNKLESAALVDSHVNGPVVTSQAYQQKERQTPKGLFDLNKHLQSPDTRGSAHTTHQNAAAFPYEHYRQKLPSHDNNQDLESQGTSNWMAEDYA